MPAQTDSMSDTSNTTSRLVKPKTLAQKVANPNLLGLK